MKKRDEKLGDNFPQVAGQYLDNEVEILGVASNGKYCVKYKEILEAKLSQDPKSSYYKGNPISKNEVEDFKIDLGLGKIMEQVKCVKRITK